MTSAMSRVHATSYTSAENPEIAAAPHASELVAAFALFWRPEGCATATRSSSSKALFAIHSAPAAAERLGATPTQVVPRRPSAGTSQKPAAIAPVAAPAVFAAYNTPASAIVVASALAATGNVAPIAIAGIPTRIA